MKILFVGAGAVGGYFGSCFSRAGKDVTFLTKEAYLPIVKKNGFYIKSINGDFKVEINAVTKAKGIFDLIVFCVKSYDLKEALEQTSENIGNESTIVSLLNGVESEEIIAEKFGKERVIGAVAFIGAAVESPGVIKHSAAGSITIGELWSRGTNRCEKIKNLFSEAKIPCKISENILNELWIKMVWNVGFNAITAITRSYVSEVINFADTEATIKESMDEAVHVAKSKGIFLRDDIVSSTILKTKQAGMIKTSMLQDIEKGKKSEVDSINGAIIRFGKEKCIPVPVNETLHNLVTFLCGKGLG